jgi:tetratricopeptide (TPR) repeat protein
MRHATLRRALLTGVSAAALSTALYAAEGRLAGTISDENGQPIEGAAVTVTTQSLASLKLDLATDAQGSFSATVPNTSWTYDLRVEKAGFGPTITQGKATASGNPALKVTLHPPLTPPTPRVDPGVLAYNEGVDLMQKGDKAGAEKKFLEAVAAKPDLASAWKVLSELAYERKDYAKALADGRKALESDPAQSDLYGILMDSAEKTGDAAAAADYRKKYREANADKPEVNYNAGVESYTAGDYAAAAGYFSKAVELKPDMASAHFWLGMSQYNLKKYAQSRASFQKYLDLAPEGDQAASAKEMLAAIPAK